MVEGFDAAVGADGDVNPEVVRRGSVVIVVVVVVVVPCGCDLAML
jgi:hypothetical protein